MSVSTPPASTTEAHATSAASSPVLDHLRRLHPEYDRLPAHNKARLLRRYAYQRTILAATSDHLLAPQILQQPLEHVFDAFDRNEGGVWCAGAADVLTKLYLAAGFRAWTYHYGAEMSLVHAVTLVEIDSRLYLQDAYFNTEYTSEDGQPIPFFEVIERLKRRRPPDVRQDLATRKAFFASEDNARQWVPAAMHAYVVCDSSFAVGILCRAPTTLERFAESYFAAPDVAASLARVGYPNDWRYLILWPTGLGDGRSFIEMADLDDADVSSLRDLALTIQWATGS